MFGCVYKGKADGRNLGYRRIPGLQIEDEGVRTSTNNFGDVGCIRSYNNSSVRSIYSTLYEIYLTGAYNLLGHIRDIGGSEIDLDM